MEKGFNDFALTGGILPVLFRILDIFADCYAFAPSTVSFAFEGALLLKSTTAPVKVIPKFSTAFYCPGMPDSVAPAGSLT